ncbi:MAG: hypothetical protein Q6J68_00450 [Thermostichales cyanobacterium SZTDM-1c_bins_54]
MELAEIRALVDQALADGKLTSAEYDAIEAAMNADGVITPEEEALLDLVGLKVRRGEIELA